MDVFEVTQVACHVQYWLLVQEKLLNLWKRAQDAVGNQLGPIFDLKKQQQKFTWY